MAIWAAPAAISSTAVAEENASTKIYVYANAADSLKDFSINETTSAHSLGSSVPTIYNVPVVVGSGDIRTKVVISATWKDEKTYEFTLNIPQFSGLPEIDLYFYRQEPITNARAFAAQYCKLQSIDLKLMFMRFFACKELVQYLILRDEVGTQTYYTGVQGWFNYSYNLSRLNAPKAPYVFDEDVGSLMQDILNKYDQGENKADIDRVIDVKDVRNKIKNVQVADIYLVNEVDRLIKARKIDEAMKVNRYVKTIFSDLQKATGNSIVRGVNADLLNGNEDHLNALLAAGRPPEGRI